MKQYKTGIGEMVLYTGGDNDQHHEGVTIILDEGLETSLMEWKPKV